MLTFGLDLAILREVLDVAANTDAGVCLYVFDVGRLQNSGLVVHAQLGPNSGAEMVQKDLVCCIHNDKVFLLEVRAILTLARDGLVLLPSDEMPLILIVKAKAEVELLELATREAVTTRAVGISELLAHTLKGTAKF